MFSPEELREAWDQVRTGGPSQGVDGVDQEAFRADVEGQLATLHGDLASGQYRPQPCRTVDVPKPSGGVCRLVIPTLRDRVAQTAANQRLLPVIEPLLHPCCWSYRRGVGVQDALEAVARIRDDGWRWGIRADIARFFDTVPHAPLFSMLESLPVDPPLLNLLRAWLRAPQETPAGRVVPALGLPQGLPVSPLLSNFYLLPFDREMARRQWRLVRYADDMALFFPAPEWADECGRETAEVLGGLGLSLSAEKTLRVSFEEGFQFLGARFHGDVMLPAQPHPYERLQTPPSPPPERRPPAQTLPHVQMRTLYVQDQGALLRMRSDRFVVSRAGETLIEIAARHVDQIYLFGRVALTSPASAFCLTHDIPVYMYSSHGGYYGVLQAPEAVPPALRRAQYALSGDPAARLAFARAVVISRVRGERRLLQRRQRNQPSPELDAVVARLHDATARAAEAESTDQLRGIEGSAAAAFFQGFARCLRPPFTFTHRIRRPPTDPVNSLLSFGYTLVFYQIHAYLHARRLDPAVGMYHEERAGHPALASDLLEEFRAPLVEGLVLNVLNRGQFGPEDFVQGEASENPALPVPCRLTDEARIRFLRAYEEHLSAPVRHPDLTEPVNWRRVLDLQALRFRRWVEGAVAAYRPFEEPRQP